ncbi:hypothetical protein DICVIV_05968 [Dictyocaulus viviparus]|uniref:Uncharacterized protein n=1 Tax=Dictyocaulus viviparus TaxID=29172 RepID=A0A0D8XTK1_DICVI|nr:hypothetical protein DICVIV_05968 [Dictyocaulus viviparus]
MANWCLKRNVRHLRNEYLNLEFTVFRCRYYQSGKKVRNQRERNEKKTAIKTDDEMENVSSSSGFTSY